MKKIIFLLMLIFASAALAANELQMPYASGSNVYAVIRSPNGVRVWNDVDGAWQAWQDANITDYDIVLTDKSGDLYVGDFNSSIAAGIYPINAYLRAGASAAVTDTLIGKEAFVNRCDYIWYVTKDGNDSYDGHSPETAKFTINAAVQAASNGDKIIIYPGDYDELVDLDANNLSCTLEGFDRNNKSRIARTGSGERGVILEDNCTLRNLAISSTSKTSNAQGIYATGKSNLTIENCDSFGGFDGMYLDTCDNVLVSNSRLTANYDGGAFDDVNGFVVRNCIFETDGSYSNSVYERGFMATGGGYGTVVGCTIEADANDGSAEELSAASVLNGSLVVFNDCYFRAKVGNTNTSDVWGVYASTGVEVMVNSSSIYTENDGSGTAYDLVNSSSTLRVDNTYYDTSKTSGTIIDRTFAIVTDTNGIDVNTTTLVADVNAILTDTNDGGSGPWTSDVTVEEIRAEMDANSTKLSGNDANITILITRSATQDANLATLITDTNELQTDWTDGGRLDTILDGVYADTNGIDVNTTILITRSATQDANLATLITDVNLIKTDSNDIQEDWATVVSDVNATLTDTNDMQPKVDNMWQSQGGGGF